MITDGVLGAEPLGEEVAKDPPTPEIPGQAGDDIWARRGWSEGEASPTRLGSFFQENDGVGFVVFLVESFFVAPL